MLRPNINTTEGSAAAATGVFARLTTRADVGSPASLSRSQGGTASSCSSSAFPQPDATTFSSHTSTPNSSIHPSAASGVAGAASATGTRKPVGELSALYYASTPVPRTATIAHFSDDEDDEEVEVERSKRVSTTNDLSSSGQTAPATVEEETSASSTAPVAVAFSSQPLQEKTAPKAKANRSRIAMWLRSRVSRNKVRYRDDEFNLDLTYITHRIVAMGYPAHGTEYYIRNPIDKVEAFLDKRHAHHFQLYNLCSERVYDSATRFHGCFRRFPFDDHNTPPLHLMCDFVVDAVTFLAEDPENVVVVHCKAGKSRTGLMVCCLLLRLFPERFPTGPQALDLFNSRRTSDGAGLTIPSQRRFVHYYERILRELNGIPPEVDKPLALCEVVVNATALQQPLRSHADFYFTVRENGRLRVDSRGLFPKGPLMGDVGMVYAFPQPYLSFHGNVKITFYRRRPIVLSGTESPGFYVWFNTSFCDTSFVVLQRHQLDKVDEAAFTKMTTVGFRFRPGVVEEPLPEATPLPPKVELTPDSEARSRQQ